MKDERINSPKIGVGLESTVDVIITFPEMENFEDFARCYDGSLSDYVDKGYEIVSSGSGGEIPIDGNKEEARRMLEIAKDKGAKIGYSLGGNAAQEAVTFQSLGAKTVFLGGIFPDSFSKLPSEKQESLKETDTSFAKIFDKYAPASYILQAHDTNRYILSEGEGRRIGQLKPYLNDLPEIIEQVVDKYDDLDVLSLVGWQVLFGNELKEEDYQFLVEIIEEIRSETEAVLFTDAGGIGALDEEERKRLWGIYSKFDILSVNEDEVSEISQILGLEDEDAPRAMLGFLKNADNLSTVWMHTPHFQITISERFSRKCLEEAQKISTLAGLYKVEKGGYPDRDVLSKLRESHEFFQEGLDKRKEVQDRYGEALEGRELILTPCFRDKEFFSTVGAGDVSSAAYLTTLASMINEVE